MVCPQIKRAVGTIVLIVRGLTTSINAHSASRVKLRAIVRSVQDAILPSRVFGIVPQLSAAREDDAQVARAVVPDIGNGIQRVSYPRR